MEHLRVLLSASLELNDKALLSFVDNDDMCHPVRFFSLLQGYRQFRAQSGDEDAAISIPSKLLLDTSMTLAEGNYEKFVDMKNLTDYTHWRKHPPTARKVTMVNEDTAEDLDAEEYFDYLVPSAILKKFFDLTPVAVTSHKFSDLRLYSTLAHVFPFDMGSTDPDIWLLAHYKLPMDEKRKAFDNNGGLVGSYASRAGHSNDQASFGTFAASAEDVALSERFGRITPSQVSMCRSHIESVAIQYIGWNDKLLDHARTVKIVELSDSHGPGFGEALWEECETALTRLFGAESLEMSKGAWKRHSFASSSKYE